MKDDNNEFRSLINQKMDELNEISENKVYYEDKKDDRYDKKDIR